MKFINHFRNDTVHTFKCYYCESAIKPDDMMVKIMLENFCLDCVDEVIDKLYKEIEEIRKMKKQLLIDRKTRYEAINGKDR